MRLSEQAQRKKDAYGNEWKKRNMTRISTCMMNSVGEAAKERAASLELSLNSYVVGLIKKDLTCAGYDLEQDEKDGPETDPISDPTPRS